MSGSWPFLLAVILSLVALVGRFRRSGGAMREQFKWVVWGASIFAPAIVVAVMFGGTRYEHLTIIPVTVAAVVFVGSYGIAVGKYRLYDIDVVINKTLVVGSVALALGATYVAIVAGVGSLLGASGQNAFGGIAKSCGWGRVVRRRPLIRGSSSQLGFRL